MTEYIVDTDTCISCLREQHDIAKKIDNIGTWNCRISQITLAELRYGAECSVFSDRRHREIDEFCEYISVVPINNSVIDIYALQKARLRKRGLLIPDFDLLIGATAMSAWIRSVNRIF
jgi:tRNA(fMet)-specific endonuclease VapC